MFRNVSWQHIYPVSDLQQPLGNGAIPVSGPIDRILYCSAARFLERGLLNLGLCNWHIHLGYNRPVVVTHLFKSISVSKACMSLPETLPIYQNIINLNHIFCLVTKCKIRKPRKLKMPKEMKRND